MAKPRKLVISRKGFDTTRRKKTEEPVYPYGGVASPIFPDGSIYSLPVPGSDPEKPARYEDLFHYDVSGLVNIGQVVEDLTLGRKTEWNGDDYAFVSPNIREPYLWKVDGRCGMVHQGTRSQSGHLRNQGFGVGDLFLFFGIFKSVEQFGGRWRFVRGAKTKHVLFGWLQVGYVHYDGGEDGPWFVAGADLDLGDGFGGPRFGVFPMIDERVELTAPGGNASEWRLPRWFYPQPPRRPLSQHRLEKWSRDGDYSYVQRRMPGQEFVLDLEEYPEAVKWFGGLVRGLGANV